VRDHEPALALYGGRDGLQVTARLLSQSTERLAPDGLLLFEMGAGQSDQVAQLIAAASGLKMLEFRRDLQAIPRAAIVARA
jgi:release factor glutamine methyltransferase